MIAVETLSVRVALVSARESVQLPIPEVRIHGKDPNIGRSLECRALESRVNEKGPSGKRAHRNRVNAKRGGGVGAGSPREEPAPILRSRPPTSRTRWAAGCRGSERTDRRRLRRSPFDSMERGEYGRNRAAAKNKRGSAPREERTTV